MKGVFLILTLAVCRGRTITPTFLAGKHLDAKYHEDYGFSRRRGYRLGGGQKLLPDMKRGELMSRMMAKAPQSSGTLYENMYQYKDGPNLTFQAKIVRSLDLVPLIKEVSRYAATRRGRDALLKLIGRESGSPNTERHGGKQRSRRKSIATVMDLARSRGGDVTGTRNEAGGSTGTTMKSVEATDRYMKISRSSSEANKEYSLVREATLALQRGNDEQVDREGCPEVLSIPPIYPASSSVDNLGEVDTDDDEWLVGILQNDGSFESLELEHILQADQIVARLIGVNKWARESSTQTLAPGLSEIGSKIDIEAMEALHEEIRDTVRIVRVRSLSDITGTRSFDFRLNDRKFPSFGILREKEKELMELMDKGMQDLLSNKSFAKKLVEGKGGAKAFDLRGRLVVSAKQGEADSLGVIRGYDKNRDACYVEPKSMIMWGNELSEIRSELEIVEKQISQRLASLIIRAAPSVESGMRYIARIDTIFARAAYGLAYNGIIPLVGKEGRISIDSFIHPVLAARGDPGETKPSRKVVPIDLMLDETCRSLVISGPNGGGKTLALKSFGLAAIMCKLGIPIPVNYNHRKKRYDQPERVDYFRDIFVEIGDQQSVSQGESTLMARLNACAAVIQKINLIGSVRNPDVVAQYDDEESHTLILLDELGGGTDPEAGSALAQAVLEKILECTSARTISTTHSPRLKALSFNDSRFSCASVLLDINDASSNIGIESRIPTFQLAYGSIGDSYALGAATRCAPSLPGDVIQRAADIISGGEGGSGDFLIALRSSIEQERETAENSSRAAEKILKDALDCRGAIVSLARAYEDHLARLENRLDTIFEDLSNDVTKSAYEIVGDSLAKLRHVKKRVKSEQEILAERGLKMVPNDYKFSDGESVVIIANGEWEGQTAVVVRGGSADEDKIVVVPSFDWGGLMFGDDFDSVGTQEASSLTLMRNQIALWDYPDPEWGFDLNNQPHSASVSDSKQKLFSMLSSIQSDDGGPNKSFTKSVKTESTFKSARERKAAAAADKNIKKTKKKRKK